MHTGTSVRRVRMAVGAFISALAWAMNMPAVAMDYAPSPPSDSMVGDVQLHLSNVQEEGFDQQQITLTRAGSAPLELIDVSFEQYYAEPDTRKAPNLILLGYSGGAHCCFTLSVVTFAPKFGVQTIPLGDGENVSVSGEPGAPPRLRVWDTNFAYWHASFAGSPGAQITLIWDARNTRYEADIAAMRQPVPDEPTLANLARELRGEPAVDGATRWPPPELWARLLDLIYGGNGTAARRLVDRAWRPDWGSKEHFLACFSQRLNRGVLWRQFDLEGKLNTQASFSTPALTARDCPDGA